MKKINFNTTAAFDVDAQRGFTPLCPEELPVLGGHLIVDECLKNHTKAKYKVMSKDAHPCAGAWTATEANPQYSNVGLPNVDIRWNSHCVVGTNGFELLKGLPHPSEYNFIIYKGAEYDMHPYSPCYHDLAKTISTGVIEWSKINGIDTFILGGLALNFEESPLCLGSAAIDLKDAGFEVIVNLAATRGIGSDEGRNIFIDILKAKDIIIVDSADEITF